MVSGFWVLGMFGLMYSVQSFRAQVVVKQQQELLEHADYDLALEKVEQARKQMPTYPDLWASRGKVLLLMSIWRHKPELAKEAERSYRQAVLLEPLNSQRWAEFAKTQILIDNNREALKSVARGLARDPYNAVLHFYKGKALQNLGQQAQALDAYKASQTIMPNRMTELTIKALEASQ